MAKLKSIIKIEGTLDGLTFYKGKEGYLVKTKGGVSSKRIKNDPAFVRTRENGAEFGHCTKSGKLLRRAIADFMVDAKDNRVTSRLTQVMSRIKNLDATSPRGERKVGIGLVTPEGKLAIKGFEFNDRALLSNILKADYTLDTTTGEVQCADFIPVNDLNPPEGATHVSVASGVLNINFNADEKDLQISPVVNLPIDTTTTVLTLTPPSMPVGTGVDFYLLKIAFFQEVNGVQYPLNNGAFNALQIVEVL
ncbi:hypothetical protein [Gaetbulibacter sp. PBL-D1]|uniref:hypothetical protein n=1 Tax=Gaetbulibacter sp. PBL-D1 TaxID=3422594 RepID=UPI003D2ED83D